MLELRIIDECLSELPAISSNQDQGRKKVELPVRSVEAVDSIYAGGGLMSAPVAGVYCATFSDGSAREILVPGTPANRLFEKASFLKEGRTGDQLSEVQKLIITGPEGIVSHTLIECLQRYEADRDVAAKLRHG